MAERGAPQAIYEELKALFTPKEIVGIISAVAMINFLNRMAIGLGTVHPAERAEARGQ